MSHLMNSYIIYTHRKKGRDVLVSWLILSDLNNKLFLDYSWKFKKIDFFLNNFVEINERSENSDPFFFCVYKWHTSCGGTSYVLVRRSTRAYASTHGNMKNIPEIITYKCINMQLFKPVSLKQQAKWQNTQPNGNTAKLEKFITAFRGLDASLRLSKLNWSYAYNTYNVVWWMLFRSSWQLHQPCQSLSCNTCIIHNFYL